MRISDWSSDVCSSDLVYTQLCGQPRLGQGRQVRSVARLQHSFKMPWVVGGDRLGRPRQEIVVQARYPEAQGGRAQHGGPGLALAVGKRPLGREIGRAQVWTPVTNAPLVCRLLL